MSPKGRADDPGALRRVWLRVSTRRGSHRWAPFSGRGTGRESVSGRAGAAVTASGPPALGGTWEHQPRASAELQAAPRDLKAERTFTRMDLPGLCSVLQIKGPTCLLQRLSFNISLLGISFLGETGPGRASAGAPALGPPFFPPSLPPRDGCRLSLPSSAGADMPGVSRQESRTCLPEFL